ncbi:MAG: PolC-type DNA polymerase III [Clostridiales bacterium]|nr:PolC-type DNA polymerase III [Clostridiales bacterium]
MTYDSLIAAIEAEVPALSGKLHFEQARYDADSRRAYLSFLADTLVGNEPFQAIRRVLVKAFPGIRISLRVASPSLAPDFLSRPAEYAALLTAIIGRSHPAAISWMPETRFLPEDEALVLELPDDFSLSYFQKQDVSRLLATAVQDIFRISPPIVMRLRDDVEKRLKRIREDREAQAALRVQEQSQPETGQSKEQPSAPAKEKKKAKRIKGSAIAEQPVAINGLTELSGRVTVAGRVVNVERRDIPGKEMVLLSFVLTDYTDSIHCKIFLRYRNGRYGNNGGADAAPPTTEEIRQLEDIVAQITASKGLKVRGVCQYDTYSKCLVLMAQDISVHEIARRKDTAEHKRVELHAHTQMSVMDGTVSAADLIAKAAKWGHEAIAITDHGVVQAYPEAFSAARANKIKLIPGLEGYMIDSTPIVRHATNRPIDDPIVVLDFETTGLNTSQDRIIEIGAVKLQSGQVQDTFSMMVNPGFPLPPKITEITGIADHMLLDAPSAEQALPKLLEFIGECPLAAHNASFDVAILNSEMARQGKKQRFTQIDTLFFAQKLYPELKRFRLNAVCKHLGVSLKNAHRAVFDATATAQILAKMLEEAKSRGAVNLNEIDEHVTGYTKSIDRHVILLATSQQGLQNINRLVTLSHLKHFYYVPKIPRDRIETYREGLLVGSACSNGEVFQAILAGTPEDQLEEIARFYDYLEVQPVENNRLLVTRGLVGDAAELEAINRRIIALGEKLSIPVVATGDSHYLEPEDGAFRAILHHSQHNEYADELPKAHLRTTDEMLEAFSWLPADKAREIVIDNPQAIAQRIGDISLYPKHPDNLTTFSPVWETANEDIRNMATDRARELYGDVLPELVQKRLDKELTSIIGYGYATLYSIANKLVSKSLEDGYLVGSRGSVGSSLVATLCGITEVNPLPPHYRCAACRTVDFDVPEGYTVGIDLPDKSCVHCGQKLIKDGFDIPFEVFLGFKGDKVPDIDLNFSGEYQSTAHAYVEELFGKGYVYRAGTIGTLQEKTAFGLVLKYMEDKGKTFSDAEKSRLALGCVGVKRTTGQHPGGIVVLPKEYEITQFTAVQHPSDDASKGVVTTHYDFGSMHDILVKLDILGHDDPTMIHMMERLSGVPYYDVPLDDKQSMSLFRSPEALGVTAEQIGCQTGTLGVPEFGTSFVRQMLMDTQPTTMEELIRISGLSHGTDVWLGNAKDLIDSGTATLLHCICTRDDIMNTLIQRGVAEKTAFDAMESVRKGKGLKPDMEAAMREKGLEEWFINSCNKIAYMFPKGHAVAYVTMALRVAWYKVHWPLQYYAAYFTIRSVGFDARTMTRPLAHIRTMLSDLNAMDTKDLSGTQKDEIVALEVVLEMLSRGFAFLPPDLYLSDASEFLIEGNGLRVPLASLSGFGKAAAQSIVEARSDPFVSIEDLRKRTSINTSGIDMLREAGALRDLSDTNQVDFFSLL